MIQLHLVPPLPTLVFVFAYTSTQKVILATCMYDYGLYLIASDIISALLVRQDMDISLMKDLTIFMIDALPHIIK